MLLLMMQTGIHIASTTNTCTVISVRLAFGDRSNSCPFGFSYRPDHIAGLLAKVLPTFQIHYHSSNAQSTLAFRHILNKRDVGCHIDLMLTCIHSCKIQLSENLNPNRQASSKSPTVIVRGEDDS
jgi:hypothetical protein